MSASTQAASQKTVPSTAPPRRCFAVSFNRGSRPAWASGNSFAAEMCPPGRSVSFVGGRLGDRQDRPQFQRENRERRRRRLAPPANRPLAAPESNRESRAWFLGDSSRVAEKYVVLRTKNTYVYVFPSLAEAHIIPFIRKRKLILTQLPNRFGFL